MNELGLNSSFNRMMYLDQQTYLTDDILCKVDRAAMSNSLETRAPFLDHRIAEFSWQIPNEFKIKNNQTKFLLRETLRDYIPVSMIERPKTGFGIPIGEWLKGPLFEWGESLITKEKISDKGYLNYDEVNKCWQEHQSGQFNWSSRLWTILMFQAWIEKY